MRGAGCQCFLSSLQLAFPRLVIIYNSVARNMTPTLAEVGVSSTHAACIRCTVEHFDQRWSPNDRLSYGYIYEEIQNEITSKGRRSTLVNGWIPYFDFIRQCLYNSMPFLRG